jgi:predicted ester cyclase
MSPPRSRELQSWDAVRGEKVFCSSPLFWGEEYPQWGIMSIAWRRICRVVGWARGGNQVATGRKAENELSAEKELVRRYFHEILDQGRVELVEEIFHAQCVMHRPGGTVVGIDNVCGVAARRRETFSQFETEIHDIFGSGDRLVARLTHRGVGGGIWRSRLGNYDVTGKAVTWNAIAIFRFEEQKIIEEWVSRDELAMVLQFGILEPAAVNQM